MGRFLRVVGREHLFERREDERQRRPQFVREVREEFDAGLVKLFVLLFEHYVLPQAAAFAGVAEDKPAHRRQQQQVEGYRPPAEPHRWGDLDPQRGVRFVPDAVVVRTPHPEKIVPRRQIGVVDLAHRADRPPFVVGAFEFVGVGIAFGVDVVEGAECEGEVVLVVFQTQLRPARRKPESAAQRAVVDCYGGDDHGRGVGVDVQVVGVEAHQSAVAADPDRVVVGDECRCRRELLYADAA